MVVDAAVPVARGSAVDSSLLESFTSTFGVLVGVTWGVVGVMVGVVAGVRQGVVVGVTQGVVVVVVVVTLGVQHTPASHTRPTEQRVYASHLFPRPELPAMATEAEARNREVVRAANFIGARGVRAWGSDLG